MDIFKDTEIVWGWNPCYINTLVDPKGYFRTLHDEAMKTAALLHFNCGIFNDERILPETSISRTQHPDKAPEYPSEIIENSDKNLFLTLIMCFLRESVRRLDTVENRIAFLLDNDFFDICKAADCVLNDCLVQGCACDRSRLNSESLLINRWKKELLLSALEDEDVSIINYNQPGQSEVFFI